MLISRHNARGEWCRTKCVQMLTKRRNRHPLHRAGWAFWSFALRFRNLLAAFSKALLLPASHTAIRLRIDKELPILVPELLLFRGEDELGAAIDATKRGVDIPMSRTNRESLLRYVSSLSGIIVEL